MLYYDFEELKEYLELLNPVKNWKDFTDSEDSLFLYLFTGIMSIFGTILVWLVLPFILIIPIKLRTKNV